MDLMRTDVDHLFSTFTKPSKNLHFLPLDTHTYVEGVENGNFWKILRTY